MKSNVMLKAMAVAVVLLLSVAGKVNAQDTTEASKMYPTTAPHFKKPVPAANPIAAPGVKAIAPDAAPAARVQTTPAQADNIASPAAQATGAKTVAPAVPAVTATPKVLPTAPKAAVSNPAEQKNPLLHRQ